jgi:hypothetical protein
MKVFSSFVQGSPTVTRSFGMYFCEREKDVKLEFRESEEQGFAWGRG